jgi:hypothetical protein
MKAKYFGVGLVYFSMAMLPGTFVPKTSENFRMIATPGEVEALNFRSPATVGLALRQLTDENGNLVITNNVDDQQSNSSLWSREGLTNLIEETKKKAELNNEIAEDETSTSSFLSFKDSADRLANRNVDEEAAIISNGALFEETITEESPSSILSSDSLLSFEEASRVVTARNFDEEADMISNGLLAGVEIARTEEVANEEIVLTSGTTTDEVTINEETLEIISIKDEASEEEVEDEVATVNEEKDEIREAARARRNYVRRNDFNDYGRCIDRRFSNLNSTLDKLVKNQATLMKFMNDFKSGQLQANSLFPFQKSLYTNPYSSFMQPNPFKSPWMQAVNGYSNPNIELHINGDNNYVDLSGLSSPRNRNGLSGFNNYMNFDNANSVNRGPAQNGVFSRPAQFDQDLQDLLPSNNNDAAYFAFPSM